MRSKSKKNKSNSKNLQRLFFAIDLEPQVKTKLITFQDRLFDPLYTKINPSNFHITLSFLGDVSDKSLEMIMDDFKSPTINSFECKTDLLIPLQPTNILALKIDDDENNLNQLAQNIERQVNRITPLNLKKKKNIPHISLFRNVETNFLCLEELDFKLDISISHFSLMVSKYSSHGVTYESIAEWSLLPKYSQKSIKEQLLGLENI